MSYDKTCAATAALRDNWDGYGGNSPTAEAMLTAREMVCVPVASGGVQIELHAGRANIEISIGPDGTVLSVSFERV